MSWNNVIPWDLFVCSRTCTEIDEREFVVHVEDCPVGQKLKERESNGSTKNSSGGAEKPEVVGGSVQVGYAGVKPGSSDSDPNW